MSENDTSTVCKVLRTKSLQFGIMGLRNNLTEDMTCPTCLFEFLPHTKEAATQTWVDRSGCWDTERCMVISHRLDDCTKNWCEVLKRLLLVPERWPMGRGSSNLVRILVVRYGAIIRGPGLRPADCHLAKGESNYMIEKSSVPLSARRNQLIRASKIRSIFLFLMPGRRSKNVDVLNFCPGGETTSGCAPS